ncbi:hypothetical protein CCR90_08010 [Rhodovulum sulfidophilum]|uniref:hypothetical protein n=1 Tax=Rhodovulum sulfidophilum TaxID=35806 RepID=UPI001F5DBC96|nr:hypothetical protein [Rhodovulum sulfidophilum]MBK5923729.1 hypothetical protein [Rhodovulum sulfidophilum]
MARATGLDMVAVGWHPTVANYLGRVTKPRIIEAVREGVGERAAQLIDHLKKGDIQEAVVTVPRAMIAETIDLVAVLSGRGSARRLAELARVRRDPLFVEVARRHLRIPGHLSV